MQPNGLIYAGQQGHALTWMDAIVAGKPVTPRIGMPVEINALWYNAIMFSLEMAKLDNDNDFINEWGNLPELIKKCFIEIFWDEKKGYLADYVNGDYKDWSVRPNQVFATSLPFTMLDEETIRAILKVVEKELLTPRGLRTLSPKNPLYKGVYAGNQAERDNAYHQGTVWPWLLGHFVEGYLKIHGKSGLNFVKNIYEGFQTEVNRYGIGSIPELYDGDPPHNPCGAISQAWSVAELLRINQLIKSYSRTKGK
jgi:predicted glycogen debranching enzyme